MILKPVNSIQVYDPENRDYLPAEGRNVDFNQYWVRRLIDNDVEELTNTIEQKIEQKGSKK